MNGAVGVDTNSHLLTLNPSVETLLHTFYAENTCAVSHVLIDVHIADPIAVLTRVGGSWHSEHGMAALTAAA